MQRADDLHHQRYILAAAHFLSKGESIFNLVHLHALLAADAGSV